jgi:hypothetical protein
LQLNEGRPLLATAAATSRELLARRPRGKDTAVTSPIVQGDGSVDVFFDRFNGTCAKSDIYKIPVPAPGHSSLTLLTAVASWL